MFLTATTHIFSQTIGTVTLSDRKYNAEIDPLNRDWQYLQQFKDFKEFSQSEKEVLYWMNQARKDPTRFYNEQVKRFLETFPTLKGKEIESLKKDMYDLRTLDPLHPDKSLRNAALLHANDLSENRSPISHKSTDGRTLADRMKAVGRMGYCGENIYEGNEEPLMAVILLLLDFGVPGAGHRKAILDPNYQLVGLAFRPFATTGNFILVQDFAKQTRTY